MKTRLVFLKVPEYLNEQLSGDFFINHDIPIPAEIPEDDGENNLENLSMEMILSGMLRAIDEFSNGESDETSGIKQEWIDYYCRFILFLRPEITEKIKEIKDNSLNSESYKTARNLILEGKAQEALDNIHVFIERFPLVWNGWFILGWALRLLGRWKDAEAALRKTIELGGDNCDIRNELAICLMETGDVTGAQAELEAALKEEPENIKIISNLGVLAFKNNETDKAAAFFRKTLEIDSGDPVAANYLKKLNG